MTKIEGFQAFAINWRESERSYGQRRDGVSLHLSKEDAKQFCIDHGMEGNAECYSFPDSLVFRVIIDEETYKQLSELQEEQVLGNRFALPRVLEAGQVVEVK